MSEQKVVEPMTWDLGPETEYIFELDPGTTLVIKVCKNTIPLVVYSRLTARICYDNRGNLILQGSSEILTDSNTINRPLDFMCAAISDLRDLTTVASLCALNSR